jgi:hypothetical protein
MHRWTDAHINAASVPSSCRMLQHSTPCSPYMVQRAWGMVKLLRSSHVVRSLEKPYLRFSAPPQALCPPLPPSPPIPENFPLSEPAVAYDP